MRFRQGSANKVPLKIHNKVQLRIVYDGSEPR